MKHLAFDTGGRPRANDDLVTLQAEAHAAIVAPYLGYGPFIVSGCHLSGTGPAYNVSAGIVCLNGQFLRFDGAGAVTLPAQFQAGPAIGSDPRPYQTGGTKFCQRETKAVLVAPDPAYTGGEFLALETWGGLSWRHLLNAHGRALGEVRYLANLTANDYDADGRGRPGTAAWGWALCNGNLTTGTADLRGQFVAGLDPARAEYDAVGKTGGAASVALTEAQLPAHTHGASSPNTNTNDTGNGRAYRQVDEQSGSDRNRRTGPSGGNQPHENRPPFFVLAVVQWVGY